MKALCRIAGVGWLLLAAGAVAQIDLGADGIGIYADLAATQTSITAEPGVAFEVYLLLTHPSAPAAIAGWECDIEVPTNVMLWGWSVAGEGWINVGSPPDFEVAYGYPPLWASDIVRLMTFVVYLTDDHSAEFYIHEARNVPGAYEWPAYLGFYDITTPIQLHPWPRLPGEPAFKVNDTSTAAVPATWGAVKSLFRG